LLGISGGCGDGESEKDLVPEGEQNDSFPERGATRSQEMTTQRSSAKSHGAARLSRG